MVIYFRYHLTRTIIRHTHVSHHTSHVISKDRRTRGEKKERNSRYPPDWEEKKKIPREKTIYIFIIAYFFIGDCAQKIKKKKNTTPRLLLKKNESSPPAPRRNYWKYVLRYITCTTFRRIKNGIRRSIPPPEYNTRGSNDKKEPGRTICKRIDRCFINRDGKTSTYPASIETNKKHRFDTKNQIDEHLK